MLLSHPNLSQRQSLSQREVGVESVQMTDLEILRTRVCRSTLVVVRLQHTVCFQVTVPAVGNKFVWWRLDCFFDCLLLTVCCDFLPLWLHGLNIKNTWCYLTCTDRFLQSCMWFCCLAFGVLGLSTEGQLHQRYSWELHNIMTNTFVYTQHITEEILNGLMKQTMSGISKTKDWCESLC